MPWAGWFCCLNRTACRIDPYIPFLERLQTTGTIALFLGGLVLTTISSTALFGLDALGADRIAYGRATLLLNAGVTIAVTAVVAWQRITNGSPLIAGLLLAVIVVPYVAVSALKPSRLHLSFIHGRAKRWLQEVVRDAQVDSGDERYPAPPSWADKLATILFLRCNALTRGDGGLLILGHAVFAGMVAFG